MVLPEPAPRIITSWVIMTRMPTAAALVAVQPCTWIRDSGALWCMHGLAVEQHMWQQTATASRQDLFRHLHQYRFRFPDHAVPIRPLIVQDSCIRDRQQSMDTTSRPMGGHRSNGSWPDQAAVRPRSSSLPWPDRSSAVAVSTRTLTSMYLRTVIHSTRIVIPITTQTVRMPMCPSQTRNVVQPTMWWYMHAAAVEPIIYGWTVTSALEIRRLLWHQHRLWQHHLPLHIRVPGADPD